MSIVDGTRYSFVAEYFDPQANLQRQYMLFFYVADNSVEMHDTKNRRVFLKRVKYPQLSVKELFVGASVTVYARVLKLIDFGDEVTRSQFAKNDEAIVVAFGASLFQCGDVVQELSNAGMRIINLRMVDPTPTLESMGITSRLVAVHVGGSSIAEKVINFGKKFPESCVITDAVELLAVGTEVFTSAPTTATMKNCAVCVIKPHAIGAGQGGIILQRIFDEGFKVTALGSFNLSIADSEDFLEVYRGVVPEYKKLTEHMASASCWAMEVRAENAVPALRAVCGPHDPDVCHVLFPHTIRSKFGLDRVLNGVHCTDLVEDGPLESEFFFDLMLRKPS